MLFFFNDTATTEIYTLSLHDALPICPDGWQAACALSRWARAACVLGTRVELELYAQIPRNARDRKSTRLNSSHANISYAVFCLKKKHLVRRDANIRPDVCTADIRKSQ